LHFGITGRSVMLGVLLLLLWTVWLDLALGWGSWLGYGLCKDAYRLACKAYGYVDV
jgi:hypothetical protein